MKSRLSKSSFNIRNGQLVSHENDVNNENSTSFNLSSITNRLNQETSQSYHHRNASTFQASPLHTSSPNKRSEISKFNSPIDSHNLTSPQLNSTSHSSKFNSPFNNFKTPNRTLERSLDLTLERTPLGDHAKVRFNASTFNIQDDLSSSLMNSKNLNKHNSKSVASLHSNATKCLSTPSAKSRQVTKRKNSVNIRQILFDRLAGATSKSNSSIDRVNKSSTSIDRVNKSSTSIDRSNQLINDSAASLLTSAGRFHRTPSSENVDDFFDYSNLAETPIVNNPQLELKLNQIRKAKSGSQSIFDLRRNQQVYDSNHSFNSTNTTTSSAIKTNSITEVDSPLKTSFQRVAKLKVQNANRFKELLNSNNKKFSQSLNDLTDLTMINTTNDWKEFGDAYQNEIRERRYIHHITEIEMDNAVLQTGATLRAIYDGDEYNKFMEKLDARIKGHDKDIERMCNTHYQGFVDCIHQLLKVRPQAEQLKKGIIEINSEMQKSSENIQKKAEELIKFRRIHCNTEKAIDHLKVCLPVLEMYSKLLGQMNEKKYYPALKTLEQLESEYLPQVSVYRFAQSILARIPKMREEIKDASMKDLKDFLETVRKYSVKMGEIAMRNAATQQNIDDSILNTSANHSSLESSTQSSPSYSSGTNNTNGLSRKSITNTSGKSKKRKAPLPPSSSNFDNTSLKDQQTGDFAEKYSTSFDEETSATDIVDFSPVYRCLHIYSCLGAREHFEQYYRMQRQQQAKLALQAPMNMHENIDGYKNYFCGIIGFFVIEDHILTTGNGLMTKEYLDSIWNNSLQSVVASLRTHSSYCTDAKLMLQIKKIVILFIHTLQSYGYNVNQLFNLLLEIRDQYNEILMKQWVTVFRNIFEADTYHPMVVNTIKELNDLLMEFPFYDVEALNKNGLSKSLSQSSNNLNGNESDSKAHDEDSAPVKRTSVLEANSTIKPVKFPFSSFVPKVFREVKNYIHECLEFSHDLNTSQTEIEDMVRKSTNQLLTKTLSGCLSALIKKPNLGLLQLIQIAINTNYLEEASVYLEDYISRTIGYNYSNLSSTNNISMANLIDPKVNSQLLRLEGRTMFKDARADAESQIYIQLNQKIDEFFELASYDWLMGDSSGLASSYVSDLIAFLRSTFEAFTNLPIKVAQTACHSACKHIANSLMGFLLNEEVKCISLGAISQLNLDLLQSEMFAGSEPVKGFEDGDLILCFAELRQLIDLFMDWDWSTYFADFGKQHSKYLRVKPKTALVLLEKVREAEKKKPFITSLKKNERDKKKLTETVIKNLKQLIEEDRRF